MYSLEIGPAQICSTVLECITLWLLHASIDDFVSASRPWSKNQQQWYKLLSSIFAKIAMELSDI